MNNLKTYSVSIFCLLLIFVIVAPKYVSADGATDAQHRQNTNSDPKMTRAELLRLVGPHLKEGMRDADVIRFDWLRMPGDSASKPVLVLSEQTNVHMFHLMKGTKVYSHSPCQCLYHCIISFYKGGKLIAIAAYFPERGALEDKMQQATMPDEVQEWIDSF